MIQKKTTPKKSEKGIPSRPLAPDGMTRSEYRITQRKKGLDNLEKAGKLPDPTAEQWQQYRESQGVFPKGKK
jgi:hypothetical protein